MDPDSQPWVVESTKLTHKRKNNKIKIVNDHLSLAIGLNAAWAVDPDPGGKNWRKKQKNARKLVAIGILIKNFKANLAQLHGFLLKSIFLLFQLQKTLHKVVIFTNFCLAGSGTALKKAAGSGSASRITAGSGSVKNECGSTALHSALIKTIDVKWGNGIIGAKHQRAGQATLTTHR